MFLQSLEVKRSDSTKIQNRRKKVNIPVGKSVCAENTLDDKEMDSEEVAADKQMLEDEPTTSSRHENEIMFNDNKKKDSSWITWKASHLRK